VVLGWRTAPWWPLLCGSVESGRGFAPFVRGQLFFSQSRKILVPGLASTDQFCGYSVPLCDVFALDVDFTDSKCLLRFSFLILFSSNVRADVFLHEGWDLTASGLPESDPEVRRLFSTLKSAAPLSRAAGTLTTYFGPWARFRAWCASKNVPCLPASPLTVSLYLTKLWESSSSPAPVLTASGAIFFHHSLAGLPSPTEHHLVKMVREIARRTRLAGQNKKNPFLASHIRRLFSLWASPESPLNKLMMLTAVTLCFTAFLRCDELLSLQWDQIRFVGQSHMELFIEHQKNDQYREGMWKIVARVGGACCPVVTVGRVSTARLLGMCGNHG
jgi:hypothetical protein